MSHEQKQPACYIREILKGCGEQICLYGYDYICAVVWDGVNYACGMTRDEFRRTPLHESVTIPISFLPGNRPVTVDGVQYVFSNAVAGARLVLKNPVMVPAPCPETYNVAVRRDDVDDQKSIDWQTGDGLVIARGDLPISVDTTYTDIKSRIASLTTDSGGRFSNTGFWTKAPRQILAFADLVFSKSLVANRAPNQKREYAAFDLVALTSDIQKTRNNIEHCTRKLEAYRKEFDEQLAELRVKRMAFDQFIDEMSHINNQDPAA